MSRRKSPTAGSSPLARGALLVPDPRGRGVRLIPARAGSTSSLTSTIRSPWAHPRSRGEHTGQGLRAVERGGSSPLARGAQHQRPGGERPRRLIPARAGSTEKGSSEGISSEAHPRSRGEHRSVPSPMRSHPGSSPLARGAPTGQFLSENARRLIPARAGSTRVEEDDPARRPAHPRSRGEHRRGELGVDGGPGSSPLARGALPFVLGQGGRDGLIPARAGSTRGSSCAGWVPWAHPRSRGEHLPGVAGNRW